MKVNELIRREAVAGALASNLRQDHILPYPGFDQLDDVRYSSRKAGGRGIIPQAARGSDC